ncbi:precorrin-6y C5,15-methyltransferase (decarboxylating), CbiE subunit [Solidesulfovibrio fructosivorans JJ]]|uniref:Precorrin-6y C5,15-methyltransferase (Decarboxylating), CbiE subunit n=1 Tax=Solidesulfovibrio fructosivorans JJ] TaxID=596151 RepID=E1JVI8_SOLFR|nr:bifunctional cobalt-precorrin-7 (C(5))-methyltransferase/cobalt-precorrin-6B (C(15))-methyltransferase [Solidesulfovibrio fructosivorans]EFL51476.1 precorrin-6y C5,15-methyltransferase (decarboxylating), CbiE subunit [Solidesulfovibrio fructosivorans JJ]]
MTPKRVAVIGCGIGRPWLAPEPADALAGAAVVVGGARQLALFPDHPARRIPIVGPLAAVCDAIETATDSGEAVCVLADGDPLFFGIGRLLVERFGSDRLTFYPSVTAVGAAAARLGRPWQDLPAVSLHGRSDLTPLFAALVRHGAAAVYTDAVNTPAVIADKLLGRGGAAFTMHVLEEMGLPGERRRSLRLAEAANQDFSPLNLTLVERTHPPEIALSLGLADDALSRSDRVFTKAPVRAVSLAGLAPRPGDVVWDVGAGTGAVALEASLLNLGGPVFAVERDPARHALLMDNIRRTGALTVTPIHGEAPDALAGLADPDRIFIGGGLTNAPDLLPELCRRLRPGGRLVANCVLLGSLHSALETLRALGWPVTLTQVQAETATPLAGDLRFCAENPVFVLTAVKESRHG